MKIFQRVQEIWSGKESVTEGQTDGKTDRLTDEQTKAISIIPHPLCGGGHEIQGWNLWPWPCVGMNMLWVLQIVSLRQTWPKFKEIPWRGIGDMEWTRNSRLKPMTLTCDLVCMVDCTSTHWGEHLTKVKWKSFKRFRRYGADKKVLRTDRRTDGQMDRRADEGHFYNPPSASRRGINKQKH